MYLVDIKPKNSQKGASAFLYLRDNGKSIIAECNLPHLVTSMKREAHIAKINVSELSRAFPHISFELKQYRNKGVIWATGPREMKDDLPNYFLKKECGPLQMLRWRVGFPFPIVSFNSEGHPTFERRDSIADLMNERAVAVDTELENWRTGKGKVFLSSFVTRSTFGNYALTTYETDRDELTLKDGTSAKVIMCADEKDHAAKLSKLFHDYDPLWVYGSNVGGFDFQRYLRPTGVFLPGVSGTEPTIEAHGGFFPRVVIEGRCVIDTAPWSLNWMWLPNNKLETLGRYLLGQGVKKDLTYEQIDRILESRDRAGMTRIAEYCLNDSAYSYDTGRWMLESLILSSMYFGVSPSSVCTTARKNLAKKACEKSHFFKFNTVEKKQNSEAFDEFSMDERKNELLKQLDKEFLTAERGLFRNVKVLHLTPFIRALADMAAFNSAGKAILQRFRTESDPKRKMVFAEIMNSYLEKPIFDIYALTGLRRLDSPSAIPVTTDYFFGYTYGVNSHTNDGDQSRPNNVQAVTERIHNAIMLVRQLLKDAEVINYSDRFLFVKGIDDQVLRQLSDLDLGICLGTADVLSSTQGQTLFRMSDGQVLAEEADLTGRKGHRTLFEQEIVQRFGQLIFTDKLAALKLIHGFSSDLVRGRMQRERLIFLDTARRDFLDYSAPAQLQERIQMMIKHQIQKGETIGYGYGTRKGHVCGPSCKKDEHMIRIPEFFSADVKVEIPMYLDKMYGKRTVNGRSMANGSIGDLVYAAFPVTTQKERKELAKVVEGDHDAMPEIFVHEQQVLF